MLGGAQTGRLLVALTQCCQLPPQAFAHEALQVGAHPNCHATQHVQPLFCKPDHRPIRWQLQSSMGALTTSLHKNRHGYPKTSFLFLPPSTGGQPQLSRLPKVEHAHAPAEHEEEQADGHAHAVKVGVAVLPVQLGQVVKVHAVDALQAEVWDACMDVPSGMKG